jgi:tetratricopeptide (TPR) repeat protein
MAATLKAALERPRTALSHANTYFDSFQYGQSLEYLQQAYDEAGKIASDPILNDLPDVIAFFETFNADAHAFKQRYDARMRDIEINKATDKVSTNLSHAKTYFASFRRDQSMEYLQQAKAALDEYMLQYSILPDDPWVSKIDGEIAAFEKEYVETVLREELNQAKACCTEPLSRVQASIDRKDINQVCITTRVSTIRMLMTDSLTD